MVSTAETGQGQERQYENVRLDTYWEYDDPARMTSLTVGDFTTAALTWSRSTRLGGVQFGTNFALQPYRTTAPLASFAGQAVLPSTVDLFVNGIKQSSQPIQPGQFQLNTVPSLNGFGQAQVVVTDINGMIQTISFPLYASASLLQKGLADWSVEFGGIRRGYGVASFDYAGTPVMSATARYGWSNDTTVESHAESSGGLIDLGFGGVWKLGNEGGVVNASMAASRDGDRAGTQGNMGYQWSSQRFNVSLDALWGSANYLDVGGMYGSPVPRETDTAYFGVNLNVGQIGLSMIRQRYPGQSTDQYVSASWSRQFDHNVTFSVNVNRSINSVGSGIFATCSIPLGRYTTVSVEGSRVDGANSVTLDAGRAVPGDAGGWGWRVQTSAGADNIAQAEVTQLGSYGQWTAGINRYSGNDVRATTTEYGIATGALTWMLGELNAMREVDDAFAVVDTSGIAGVPVKLDNRLIGTTDAQGLFFVNRLNSYQHNEVSIDPLQLPADMQIMQTSLETVPELHSGALAHFDLRRVTSVQASLHDEHGRYLEVGSRVWANAAPGGDEYSWGPATTIVGYDGLIYLQDPPSGTALSVMGTSGNPCVAVLPSLDSRSGIIDAGALVCHVRNATSEGAAGARTTSNVH